MNRFFLTLLLSLFTIISQAAEIKTSSKIESANVFLRGGIITRTATTNLPKGVNKIVFTGLSNNLQGQTVRVKGKGAFTILSVKDRVNYIDKNDPPAAVKAMQDDLDELKLEQSIDRGLKTVYEQEKKMVLANQQVGWQNGDFDVEDLADLADFYRNRLSDLSLKILQMDGKLNDRQKEIKKLQNQLNQSFGKGSKNLGEVVVEVAANAQTRATFELQYQITQCGWSPLYDVRSEGTGKQIELTYNAQVYQNSGIDWEGVKLTLTTRNPNVRNTPTALRPQMIWNVNQMKARGGKTYEKAQVNQAYLSNAAKPVMEASDDVNAVIIAQHTTVSAGQLNSSFIINLPYDIPSDNDQYTVNIDNHKLDADYIHISAPKADPAAFLVARIAGLDKLSLLQGPTQVYFEGTFVGKSYLNPNQFRDTMEVSLGRDENIVICRKKTKDYTADQTFGGDEKRELEIEISIKNKGNASIKLRLEDQIPISSKKDITVTTGNLDGASLSDKSGKLIWNLNIPAGGSPKKTFDYEVKYPKDLDIQF